MRYFGSKSFTAEKVEMIARKNLQKSFYGSSICDPFGGIGMMASTFKQKGWRVFISDHLLFPHYYQRARLESSSPPTFKILIEHLRFTSLLELEAHIGNLPPSHGWFTSEFSVERNFFSLRNATKVDSIWCKILEWDSMGLLNEREKAFLLASLVDSFDKVANTAGTYYAYLKGMTRKALNDICFNFIQPVIGDFDATCLHKEAIQAVSTTFFDVLYLDPPYSARSYDRYYHLPQTIASGQSNTPMGMSGVPSSAPKNSLFESPRTAEGALSDLVRTARCSTLMIQYAAGGLISLERIREIMSTRGHVEEVHLATIGYTTKNQPRTSQHSLFVVTNAS
jgi:adenine-specific DNA-methyltransferase